MRSLFSRIWPQPVLGVATASVAVGLVAATWLVVPTRIALDHGDVSTLVLAIGLVAAYILTNHYPIHIRSDMPVCVGSVPALLIATLLPVPQAALGLPHWEGDRRVDSPKGARRLLLRRHRSQAGRWVIVGIAGSIVAHLPSVPGVDYHAPLIAAVAVMWLGDIVTAPLVLYPIIGDSPLKLCGPSPARRELPKVRNISSERSACSQPRGITLVGPAPGLSDGSRLSGIQIGARHA